MTRRRTTGGIGLALMWVACAPAPLPAGIAPRTASKASAFVDVSVVPMDREVVLEHQTVVVRDGRIESVGPAPDAHVPGGTFVIDGKGKFLIPGLADMYTYAGEEHDDRFFDVANGVTELLVMRGSPERLDTQRRIARGDAFGPWMYVASNKADGAPPCPGCALVTDAASANEAADQARAAGLDLIPVWEHLTPAAFDALADAARRDGERLAGPVPELVGLAHALAAGQAKIDVLFGYAEYLQPASSPFQGALFFNPGLEPTGLKTNFAKLVSSWSHIDESRIPGAVEITRRAGAWNCPTLTLLSHFLHANDPAYLERLPGIRAMPAVPEIDHDDFWLVRDFKEADFAALRAAWPKLQEVVRALGAGGGRILAGTRTGMNPGFALVEELTLLVQAGLSPYEALRAATSGAAEFLHASGDFGTVARGRRADLVLLDGDPLASIDSVAKRSGVMLRGRWLPEAELERRLANIEAINHGARSRFGGVKPPPVEGERVFVARYERRTDGQPAGEEREVEDRLPDGTRVIKADRRESADEEAMPMTVRLELGKGSELSLRVEDEGGSRALQRSGGTLSVVVTPRGGAQKTTALAAAPESLLVGPTLPLAALIAERVGALAVGASGRWPMVSAGEEGKADYVFGATRQPDGSRRVGSETIPVRVFATSFEGGESKDAGTMALDATGHVVEWDLGGTLFRRVE